MVVRAPAKLNLCLYLGGMRDDGLHELRSLFCPLALSDRITVTSSDEDRDEVICPGVEGPNLAEAALASLRERGWGSPPLRIEIDKRIPVAAGLGGGSSDAAAVLRLAEGEVDGLPALAQELGADVPSQLEPGFALVGGVGERLELLRAPAPFGVVLIPFEDGLGAGEVYTEADRLGLGREEDELGAIEGRLRDVAGGGASPLSYKELLVNDLERAAVSLRPQISGALEALSEAGAEAAFVTGSGPTAVGMFDDIVAADRAYGELGPKWAHAIVTASVPRP
ncbi:MAG: 4-diphosphocytidyl-2-C-methyl-D-erythritol kinase [Solirubrobacterales bacterium]|jgi:4-diphosphocytidyl-2-C-methyl-D-erythritol kinase|nr:4-diphosphocytidyl-2-C-methyl-D-erythritol kinase [Solirubrobacterales bacterium]